MIHNQRERFKLRFFSFIFKLLFLLRVGKFLLLYLLPSIYFYDWAKVILTNMALESETPLAEHFLNGAYNNHLFFSIFAGSSLMLNRFYKILRNPLRLFF